MLPSGPWCAPKKRTEAAEKMGLGPLPNELWCSSNETNSGEIALLVRCSSVE